MNWRQKDDFPQFIFKNSQKNTKNRNLNNSAKNKMFLMEQEFLYTENITNKRIIHKNK